MEFTGSWGSGDKLELPTEHQATLKVEGQLEDILIDTGAQLFVLQLYRLLTSCWTVVHGAAGSKSYLGPPPELWTLEKVPSLIPS